VAQFLAPGRVDYSAADVVQSLLSELAPKPALSAETAHALA